MDSSTPVEERLRLTETELIEAREQQSATWEILRVIRQSHTAKPVFDTIALAAMRLCHATAANVFTFDGRLLHVAATTHSIADPARATPAVLRGFPKAPGRGLAATRSVLTGAVVEIPDVERDADYERPDLAAAIGFRSILCVPLLRQDQTIGVLAVGRPFAGSFPSRQLALLQTFADQAVIAIENARLFSELEAEVEAHRRSRAAIQALVEEKRGQGDAMVGDSPALRRVREQVDKVAPMDSSVLIQGETGTGKELVARTIHALSRRREGALITVNCAALPRELVESELFGHEKGAFTGASQQRRGRFELADGGTLFLDEVGELPLEAQAKLLRVLQGGEFERVGGTRSLRADVRVIAATNRNLQAQLAGGHFRQDLFYRLNVFPIVLPPLRERRADIPQLVQHLARHIAKKLGRPLERASPAFIEKAVAYDWPGNIRELENAVERALIVCEGGVLEADDLLTLSASPPHAGASIEELERAHIRRVLEQAGWRIEGADGAAQALGLNPSTLRGRMRKLGIAKPA
jgi:transcriptional regulator with GAF, ATPase, and Fis domain